MSNERKLSQTEFTDKVPLLNDNSKHDDRKTEKSEALNTLHGPEIEEIDPPSSNVSNIDNDDVDSSQTNSASVTDPNQNKRKTMTIYYAWQLICLLFIGLTVYETYQNVLPSSHKYPVPKHFFAPDSHVIDYPRGHLSIVHNKVATADLTFVFFYAPWSAESQHARPIYEAVAKLFSGHVSFIGINCWQPDGECRHEYKKVLSWPVLMAYTRHNTGVSFTGHWTEDSLTKFVYNTLRPVQRVVDMDELLAQFHKHDALAVLFVDMAMNRTSYELFYRTALKWLEHDPYGDVEFVVVTGVQTMKSFEVHDTPTLRLYLWNQTLEYEETVWRTKSILSWIQKKLYKSSYWITPPGVRSKVFDVFTKKGPMLLLFTPRNLYDTTNDAYSMLRQVSFEYGNCGLNQWVGAMARVYMFQQRLENFARNNWLSEDCEAEFAWNLLNGSSKKRSFTDLSHSGQLYGFCPIRNKTRGDSQQQMHLTSMVDDENDPRSALNVRETWRSFDCDLSHLSRRRQASLFVDETITMALRDGNFNNSAMDKITGMACRTNRTLSFLAMDSYHYKLLAERLGVTLDRKNRYSAAVIVNGQDETTHVLTQPLTTMSLIDFVQNFTMRLLPRHLRNDDQVKHSYFFNAETVNRENRKYFYPQKNQNSTVRVIENIRLETIPAAKFEEFIWQPNKTTAVLFTSTQCGFCKIFSSALLTVSRILKEADFLQFGTIDVDRNDLPWYLTMDSIPTLIIFHGDNTMESRKYPSALKITTANVLRFILSNLNQLNRIKSFVHILQYQREQRQLIEPTVLALRKDIETSIVENLRIWRQIPMKRSYTLKKIQALRQLFLHIYRQTDKENCDLVGLRALVHNIASVWLHQ